MTMLCPECRGPLVTWDGQTATCTLHGGQYRILFSRAQALAPLYAVARGEACSYHPEMRDVTVCAWCGLLHCTACGHALPDGTRLCPVCLVDARTSHLQPPGAFTRARRAKALGSLALAGVGSLVLITTIISLLLRRAAGLEVMVGVHLLAMLGVLVVSVIGTTLGNNARERGAVNPPITLVGLLVNIALLVATFLGFFVLVSA